MSTAEGGAPALAVDALCSWAPGMPHTLLLRRDSDGEKPVPCNVSPVCCHRPGGCGRLLSPNHMQVRGRQRWPAGGGPDVPGA